MKKITRTQNYNKFDMLNGHKRSRKHHKSCTVNIMSKQGEGSGMEWLYGVESQIVNERTIVDRDNIIVFQMRRKLTMWKRGLHKSGRGGRSKWKICGVHSWLLDMEAYSTLQILGVLTAPIPLVHSLQLCCDGCRFKGESDARRGDEVVARPVRRAWGGDI